MRPGGGNRAVFSAIGLYIVWVVATYALEGLPRTLLRPEAAALRLTYAVLANLLIGTVCAILVIRSLVAARVALPSQLGFRGPGRSAVSVFAAIALGLLAYVGQGAPSLNPLVMINGYAQVLVVSIAEVLVCWIVVGSAIQLGLGTRHAIARRAALVVGAALLFGLYHFAHSPPFNSLRMVALLSAVGIATGLFFVISGEVYGTILFHNFLALFGVLRAVQQSVGLEAYARLQVPLVITAVAGIALLVGLDLFWLRPRMGVSDRLPP